MKEFTDQELLLETAALVKTERQTTAKVLGYLSEIDERRLWLKEGYSSLFDFCVRYLNYSEGEANRRIQAARCVARVEAIKPLLEQNALSLTGLSLIAPFVTKENAATLVPEVCGKSVREIEKVLVATFPNAKAPEAILKIVLDDELKALWNAAMKSVSEKLPEATLKKVLRRFLAKGAPRNSRPKTHTRYVPASVKREVKATSDGQCTYRSSSGVRCNQTAHLETDHIRPWAKGGSSWDATNLRLLCRAHNRMLGREAFPRTPGKPPSLSREIPIVLAAGMRNERGQAAPLKTSQFTRPTSRADLARESGAASASNHQ
jgi:5-methylcytosine-specific restriction endonuclease McrA